MHFRRRAITTSSSSTSASNEPIPPLVPVTPQERMGFARSKTQAVLKATADYSTASKSKPKFELHLKIYDLNNVPLVSGQSLVKWNLNNSIHAEHRGRTPKCPIANHRIEYHYSRVIPSVRIAVGRFGTLAECPLEVEVHQEFDPGAQGGREEKIVLGVVRFNLSEYVEESDAIVRELGAAFGAPLGRRGTGTATGGRIRGGGEGAISSSTTSGVVGPGMMSPVSNTVPSRKRASSMGTASTGGSDSRPSTSTGVAEDDCDCVEDGIIRRYLMQDSKINSTLRISILMVQVDGDRNYIAPPLRDAPVFGGIAGLLMGEKTEQQDEAGPIPTTSKSKDVNSEVYDMYRHALTASWTRQPDELPADECIEDIFSGGDGWKLGGSPSLPSAISAPPPTATSFLSSVSPRPSPRFPVQIYRTISQPHIQVPSHDSSGDDDHLSPPASAHMFLRPRATGYASFNASTDTLRPSPRLLQIPSPRSFNGGGNSGGGGLSSATSSSSLYDSGSGAQSPMPMPVDVRGSGGGSNQAGHRRKHSGTGTGTGTGEPAMLMLAAAAAAAAGDLGMGARMSSVGGYSAAPEMDAGGFGMGLFGAQDGGRSRGQSIASFSGARNADMTRLEGVVRRAREVDEIDVRDDLVAWQMSEKGA